MDNDLEKKDLRYIAAKACIENKEIANFKDIFDIIPMTIVAIDLGIAYKRLKNKIVNPRHFRLGELMHLAELLDVDLIKLIRLLINSQNKR